MSLRTANGPEEVQSFAGRLARRIADRTGHMVRSLHVELQDNCCVLSGRAPSYYVKQIAQVVALEMTTAAHLENRIAVEPSGHL